MTDTFRKEYKELSSDQKDDVADLKDYAEAMLKKMNDVVPDEERSERSRQMSIARTKLEECVMWAVKAATA